MKYSCKTNKPEQDGFFSMNYLPDVYVSILERLILLISSFLQREPYIYPENFFNSKYFNYTFIYLSDFKIKKLRFLLFCSCSLPFCK